MNITTRLSIDVNTNRSTDTIFAKQNDHGSRFLNITVLNNNKKLYIDPLCEVIINAKRIEGESKSFAGTINEDGTITVPLTSWILEVAGIVECDISIINNENKLTTSFFTIDVQAASNPSDNVSKDENYDVLVELIRECKLNISEVEKIQNQANNGEFNGKSVTISTILHSTADGGENVVTFSDGEKLTVRNGKNGKDGKDGKDGALGGFFKPEVTDNKDDTITFKFIPSEPSLPGVMPITIPLPKGQAGATPHIGANGNWWIKDTDTGISAYGVLEFIPEHWKAHLESKADEVRQKAELAGRNKSAFLFYTDAHWDYGAKQAPMLLNYLYRNTQINKTVFGGDIVNSEPTSDTLSDRSIMSYLQEWRKAIRTLPNHHSVVGNHDDGNSSNNIFSEEYIYSYLIAPEETCDMICGDGIYYYIDDPCEKTRYLYLDTAYKGLTAKQNSFITEALKIAPKGQHIVAIAHCWYTPDYDQYSTRPVPIAGYGTGIESLLTLFDNYNSRIGEFADCGGWIEFCIGGHIHYDHVGYSSTGIPIICCETDSKHIRGSYTATESTVSESAVSAVIADYGAHKISVIRIGRGENMEINVTNYPVNYTNLLPLATDTDGSVYNGIGYKPDTRWSTSRGAEVEETGAYLSGYIPVSAGQTVYLKNVNIFESSSKTMLFLYSAYGIHEGGQNATNMTAYQAAVWDSEGKLVKFNIPENLPITFIRLQGDGFDSTSIVTVDEPIE